MATQTVFQRFELKYLLTDSQQQRVLQAMEPYMEPDAYGNTTIRNVYYDTDTFLLARRSLERPVYKEKLRLRSYDRATAESPVYVELKKKFDHVVFKRRVCLPRQEATDWLTGRRHCGLDSQICREVDFFLNHYGTLGPRVFLAYDRQAYYDRTNRDFRVTFDRAICCRRDRLSLESPVSGVQLLPPGQVLMELKCAGGIPLWMTQTLSREKLYKTTFSKYGMAYKQLIVPGLSPGGRLHKLQATGGMFHV